MFRSKRNAETETPGETGAGTGNRTGISQSPDMALDLIREAQRTRPELPGDARVLAEYRASYLAEKQPMGSRPQPRDGGRGGAGDPQLLDKLGERLAFERQGVRLYEGLVGKAKLLPPMPGGPFVADLEHILAEEREHFRFLQQAVVEAGGDPTVLTPCANIAAVLSQGVIQVITDPRSTLVQCLEAILVAELADNDGWTLLKRLAPASGLDGLVERIEAAEAREREHLEKVRGWLAAAAGVGAKPQGRPATAAKAPASPPSRTPAKPKAAGRRTAPARKAVPRKRR